MFKMDEAIHDIYGIIDKTNDAEIRGRFLGRVISILFNTFSSGTMAKACAEEIVNNTHHTIQQQIMSGVEVFLKTMSENEYTDPRNQQAVEAAKVAYQALVDNKKTHFPMI